MKELPAIVRALQDEPEARAAMATLVSVAGSSYRRPGARLLMTESGRRVGSISGGCLEEDVLLRARQVLASGKPDAVVYDTSTENDLVWGVGLGCHGVVRVFIEQVSARVRWVDTVASNLRARTPTELAIVHESDDSQSLGTHLTSELPESILGAAGVFREAVRPPPALIVFGAGDDAMPIVRFAKELGWHVTVADPRSAFANAERFPLADALHAAPAESLVERVDPEPEALAVVMTHHYVHDVPVLGALLRRPLRYVGLLGPRKRAEKILADLSAIDPNLVAPSRLRLHAPVGLDLGADTPEQVALAIIAEMQATLGGRDARPLRERIRPIHG